MNKEEIIREYMAELGRKGCAKRWAKVSKEDRKKQMAELAKRRLAKRRENNKLNK